VKALLDTRALLWWLSDDGQLGSQARAMIADPGNEVLVSMVSLWEIIVKMRVGKLEADVEEIVKALERDRFMVLDIGLAHLLTLTKLPMHHRDPFDHLLVAQAITENAIFISEDQNIQKYAVHTVTCSIEKD
jgi:PIN domain nuclease of toxin-antitoxin system